MLARAYTDRWLARLACERLASRPGSQAFASSASSRRAARGGPIADPVRPRRASGTANADLVRALGARAALWARRAARATRRPARLARRPFACGLEGVRRALSVRARLQRVCPGTAWRRRPARAGGPPRSRARRRSRGAAGRVRPTGLASPSPPGAPFAQRSGTYGTSPRAFDRVATGRVLGHNVRLALGCRGGQGRGGVGHGAGLLRQIQVLVGTSTCTTLFASFFRRCAIRSPGLRRHLRMYQRSRARRYTQ